MAPLPSTWNPRPSTLDKKIDSHLGTLGARDFSSAVSGFCQVFIVTRAKIPAAREKNLWYPG